MQASNQTLGAILAKPATGGNQGDIGSGAVTNYNRRDNSFDNVLKEQRQRHSGPQEQKAESGSRQPSESRVARENERPPATSEDSSGNVDPEANGNTLPAEAEDSATPDGATELSGVVPNDLDSKKSRPTDVVEGAERIAADAVVEVTEPGQNEPRAGGEMITTAPVAVTSSQRQAGQSVVVATPAGEGQANIVSAGNARLQETQAFKDALQQIGKGDVAAASTAAAPRAEAAALAEQATQNLLRTESLLNPAQASATGKPEVALSTIQVPVSSPNWGQAVAQRILWMASNGVQAAELQLHPRELGPVDIRISVSNDQTQVQFSSQYGVVRESLESSMQRLRELFDASGLQLVDVNVSDQSLAEQNTSDDELQDSAGKSGTAEQTAPLVNATAEQVTGTGLVDYYA